MTEPWNPKETSATGDKLCTEFADHARALFAVDDDRIVSDVMQMFCTVLMVMTATSNGDDKNIIRLTRSTLKNIADARVHAVALQRSEA